MKFTPAITDEAPSIWRLSSQKSMLCPGENCRIEVRPIFEMEDFPPDVRERIGYDPGLHPGG